MALLRKAGEISAEGHRAAMLAPEPAHEYEIQAVVEYTFIAARRRAARVRLDRRRGRERHAAPLHEGPRRRRSRATSSSSTPPREYEGYAADVTRTIPVSGTLHRRTQRKLYQLVRDAQAAAERNSKPGMSAKAAQDSSIAVRAKGLVALGLAEIGDGDVRSAVAGELHRQRPSPASRPTSG